ncbi:MAG: protein-L-isoaspartate(D-aspartate) O-methyltransferase [Candidatus Omnitrophica bacterium]|nr:protein-L-isoaspartate(D-aspartate) O-methyltransferase [Candidatus Omnitrophota bacterium]
MRLIYIGSFIVTLVIIGIWCSAFAFDPELEREKMVREQIDHRGAPLTRTKVRNERVLEAMRAVPRHEFIPTAWRFMAYWDRPVPIGYEQTISQPYIVAFMTESIDPQSDDKVLEIGTGSGYQAAVLALLVKEVYTIEIVEPLGRSAEKVLKKLGYDNIKVRIGDGYFGWEEHAPFDAIIVTAAAPELPKSLLKQLRVGGKLCIPVGEEHAIQDLMIVTKNEDGSFSKNIVMPVRFVPLTGEHPER